MDPAMAATAAAYPYAALKAGGGATLQDVAAAGAGGGGQDDYKEDDYVGVRGGGVRAYDPEAPMAGDDDNDDDGGDVDADDDLIEDDNAAEAAGPLQVNGAGGGKGEWHCGCIGRKSEALIDARVRRVAWFMRGPSTHLWWQARVACARARAHTHTHTIHTSTTATTTTHFRIPDPHSPPYSSVLTPQDVYEPDVVADRGGFAYGQAAAAPSWGGASDVSAMLGGTSSLAGGDSVETTGRGGGGGRA